jgi:phosphatidylethanolamine/phosphatidyl-N-methylethanolamine N-methyltransferase
MQIPEFYDESYRKLQSQGLIGWYITKSHLALEKQSKAKQSKAKQSILEVGANIGEHLRFVPDTFSSYRLTDFRDTGYKSQDSRVVFEVVNVESMPYKAESFDRVISTCLLHHLDNPIKGLIEMRRVTKRGGQISILLPCDPGIMYRAGKGMRFKSKWNDIGIEDVKYFHYEQHRNHYPGIRSYIGEVFKADRIHVSNWPLLLPFWNLNLFSVITIEKTED